ncbi:MAG: methylated-DNA--[protein]-cysteine S-methyltransferase [Myxococcota bacterium]
MVDAPKVATFVGAMGTMGIVWRPRALLGLAWAGSSDEAMLAHLAERHRATLAALDPDAAPWVEAIQRHLAGEVVDLEALPLELPGASAYRLAVYAAARQIPRGTTTTYGALAAAAGHPGTAQAVGTAMAENPCPIVIPCHRVVGKASAGGFSAPGGLKTKARLLEIEGGRLGSEEAQLSFGLSDPSAG